MSDIVLAIQTRLKADAAITAITGSRIYRVGAVPANPTMPYLIVSKVDPVRQITTHNRVRTGKTRVQCSVFASTDVAADNLSELMADNLNMVTDTYLPPGVFAISIIDQGAVPDVNSEVPVYMYHRDFMIVHNV